jgi:hypothetical protein
MKHSIVALTVLAVASLTATSSLAQKGGRVGGQAAFRNGWLMSLEQGKAQARQSGKPLIVVVRCVP